VAFKHGRLMFRHSTCAAVTMHSLVLSVFPEM
jgi:hypothetical protein